MWRHLLQVLCLLLTVLPTESEIEHPGLVAYHAAAFRPNSRFDLPWPCPPEFPPCCHPSHSHFTVFKTISGADSEARNYTSMQLDPSVASIKSWLFTASSVPTASEARSNVTLTESRHNPQGLLAMTPCSKTQCRPTVYRLIPSPSCTSLRHWL